jgi:lysozyme
MGWRNTLVTTDKARLIVAALTLSAGAFIGLVSDEGYTDKAVIPIKGDVPTLGFGTTNGVKLGDKTDPVKALTRAMSDIQKFEGALKQCVKVPLYQHEYDAYVDFSYNVGSSAFCNSTMVRKLNAYDYIGACNEFDKWIYFQGKDCRVLANKCSGLPIRRERQKRLCLQT